MTYVESKEVIYKFVRKPELISTNEKENFCITAIKSCDKSLGPQETVEHVQETMFQILSKNLTEVSYDDLIAICAGLLIDRLYDEMSAQISICVAMHKIGKL
jgi:hypothetical protein